MATEVPGRTTKAVDVRLALAQELRLYVKLPRWEAQKQ